MARIGINATAISPSGKGVSNYQRSIIEALSELDVDHEYFVFLDSAYGISLSIQKQNWHLIPVPILNHFFWEQFQLPYYARKFKLDLFHSTSDRPSVLLSIPQILFLFEIPHYRCGLNGNSSGKLKIYSRISERLLVSMFPRSLKQTKCILVSSHNTKKDLMAHFQIDPGKIRVNYPGCGNQFKPIDEKNLLEIRKQMGAPQGYVLHFATGDSRENTDVVVESFNYAKGRLPKGIKLILAGGGANGPYASENIICLPFLTGESLIRAYQGAKLYIDPSFYEGFGFQIVEAMACGVPVIVSNKTCIPEIVGDAGFLSDPGAEQMGQAIVRVLTDERLWNKLRQKGIDQAKKFDWQETARQTLAAYEDLLERNGKIG